MSKQETIIDSFDTWTDAQGLKSKGRTKSIENISLEGIKRLRELILDLAIRGKLVLQDPKDEPTRDLLERIVLERNKLGVKIIADNEIKTTELPYNLPGNWEFVRLHQIIRISSGDGLTASRMNKDGSIPVFGGNGITGYHDSFNVSKPSLIIGRVGYYCGSIHLTPSKAWVTDNAFVTRFSEGNVDINFLSWLLKGTDLKQNQAATAQPVISGRKIYPIVVGLPPSAEQKRIVAKVDKLMALCDQLEEQRANHLQTHHLLVKTLLGTLTQAQNVEEVAAAWQRLEPHFDTLFCTEDSIDQLRQCILQLGIMGRLVPQDPNDEPASELLKKIRVEKARLIKEGKIKKQRELHEISDQEKPFEIPDNWEWVKFGEVSLFINGDRSKNYPNKSEYVNEGIPWINTGHIERTGKLSTKAMNYITQEKFDTLRSGKIQNGDLVYCLRGATFGKTAFVEPYKEGAVASSLMIMRPYILELNKFVFLYLTSPLAKQQLFRFDNGSAQPNLSANSVMEYSYPLPPLSEQNKIVTKVKELFAICDFLSERLKEAQKLQSLLSQTIVKKAV